MIVLRKIKGLYFNPYTFYYNDIKSLLKWLDIKFVLRCSAHSLSNIGDKSIINMMRNHEYIEIFSYF